MSVSSETFLEPIAGELRELERRLHQTVAADLGPIAEAMEHIVSAGGKRLRPALVILSAKLGEADIDHVYSAAMGIEFIHTATLIHDDLIDDAETRRGLATIHAVLGVNPAIIVGDYYFGKGANLLSAIGIPLITEVVSATVMKICMGELLQLTSKRHYEQPDEAYYTKIERKTATMLSAACHCGAIVAGLDAAAQQALERYGRDLGVAFQIADDVLDYTATEEQLGKPTGADLRQGTVTLPLMCALRDPAVAPSLRALLAGEQLTDAQCDEVVALVRRSTGLVEAERSAHEYADRARAELAIFPPSEARSALESICDYVVERRT
ncbi:MAG TPA: polyprenyl synthetase family protein [Candidatus Dormibacteraeota bacterium]|jgi:heptaprenyl diphosphate synthase|nr:polyprenyl synthetase family protein [Candidatus Dormibacteraeota bacterium]